jgi:NAD(P)-dependent dehydrogenase (short-subunit alcohol dehydrogenase family)
MLVNNAGNVRAGRLDKLDAMIDVDLLAPILFAREALPRGARKWRQSSTSRLPSPL